MLLAFAIDLRCKSLQNLALRRKFAFMLQLRVQQLFDCSLSSGKRARFSIKQSGATHSSRARTGPGLCPRVASCGTARVVLVACGTSVRL